MQITKIYSSVNNYNINKHKKNNSQNKFKNETFINNQTQNISFGNGAIKRWITKFAVAALGFLSSCQNAAEEKGIYYFNKYMPDPVNRVVHYYKNVGYVGETLFDSIVTPKYKMTAQNVGGKVKPYKTPDGGLFVYGSTNVLYVDKETRATRSTTIDFRYHPAFNSKAHMDQFEKRAELLNDKNEYYWGDYIMLNENGTSGAIYKKGQAIAKFNESQNFVPIPRQNIECYVPPNAAEME